MGEPPQLAVLAMNRATICPNGSVRVSEKFLEGVREYARLWPGSVAVHMEPAHTDQRSMDDVVVRPTDLPFQLTVEPLSQVVLNRLLLQAPTVVLAILAARYLHLQRSLDPDRGRWVAFAEYSLDTLRRMAALSSANPVVRLRRVLGTQLRDLKVRSAARLAAGLQCNGTPAYDDYGPTNSNTLLYFDGRLSGDMLPTAAQIDARMTMGAQAGKIRLVFSGRLVTIKGADHLVDVALELRRLGVAFEMAICGDGDLARTMQQRINAMHLDEVVQLRGVLEFKSELVPFVRHWADLFVCCHRQGDPSCTYVETLGCGVPIVGYHNQAFTGIARASQAGWLVPVDQPRLIAQKIAQLAADRDALRTASMRALEFARLHTFEKTFAARTQHLLAALPNRA